MSKTKLVVYREHTLGYIQPDSRMMGVLHASTLRGATSTSCPLSAMDPICITNDKDIRLASAKDFDDFRCSFEGYTREEYEFAE